MKMARLWRWLVLVGLLLLPMVGQAAPPRNVEERIQEQQARIDQGIASGSLTRNEADDLQDNLNWIKHQFARYRADGYVSRDEQRALDRLLDQNNDMIYKKKRNPIGRFYDRDFQRRIADQQKRIDQGIRAKTLNPWEAATLQDNLNRIKEQFTRMRWDGSLDMRERDRLDEMLDRNSRMIYNKKHNQIQRLLW